MSKDTTRERDYWNSFYATHKSSVPSQFCALFAVENNTAAVVVEFGCGNGRDSMFLAQLGYNVRAFDLSENAIENNSHQADGIDTVSFETCDVSETESVIAKIEAVKAEFPDLKIAIYTRFFLHSLDDEQELAFLTALSRSLQPGDQLFFEFRSMEDAHQDKVFGSHYRRYVVVDDLIKTLENKFDFKVTYSIVGQGMAKFHSEDPFVARIFAEKKTV
tara:strand:+ start:597 stop:1250 length:654 start_codon:yes stop_codon:yes gene_type:complete